MFLRGDCLQTLSQWLRIKLFNRLRNAKLLDKESPKDIIEMAKTARQIKMRGSWHRSEIPERIRKIFATN
jgi:hypothetical protein